MNRELEENLHILNRFAGFYKQRSKDYSRKEIEQEKYKERKEALYSIKYTILRDNVNDAKDIEIHEIDGKLFYCLYFTNYSFHIPCSMLDIDVSADVESLSTFEKSSSEESTSKLYSVFQYLEKEYGIDPNSYLSSKIIQKNNESAVVQWNY